MNTRMVSSSGKVEPVQPVSHYYTQVKQKSKDLPAYLKNMRFNLAGSSIEAKQIQILTSTSASLSRIQHLAQILFKPKSLLEKLKVNFKAWYQKIVREKLNSP